MKKHYFGIGSTKNLGRILTQEKPKIIFLVTGKKSYKTSGAQAQLETLLNDYNHLRFWKFQLNPRIEDIKKGISVYKKLSPDLTVAIGGGSVIDIAKSINSLANQPQPPEEYVVRGRELINPGRKLIAIPTTSGSGSQATHFSTVYIGKTKYSLAHRYILPNYSIVDPRLTFTLPPRITAISGMDALAHSIESYWSVSSIKKSRNYAEQAIILILDNIVKATELSTKKSRIAMSKAAHLAGKAINISKTTACHAISYPLTSYFNIPHGHAVSLTLSSILVFNSKAKKEDILDKRGLKYTENTISNLVRLLGANNVDSAKKTIDILMKGLKLETRLKNLGLATNKEIEIVVENALASNRVNNNPRTLEKNQLKKILRAIL